VDPNKPQAHTQILFVKILSAHPWSSRVEAAQRTRMLRTETPMLTARFSKKLYARLCAFAPRVHVRVNIRSKNSTRIRF